MNSYKKARLCAGLTLQEEANLLGVSHVSVWQWENGIARPRPGRLQEVAELLHTTVSELLDGEKEGLDDGATV